MQIAYKYAFKNCGYVNGMYAFPGAKMHGVQTVWTVLAHKGFNDEWQAVSRVCRSR